MGRKNKSELIRTKERREKRYEEGEEREGA